jgi:hypothetical protein
MPRPQKRESPAEAPCGASRGESMLTARCPRASRRSTERRSSFQPHQFHDPPSTGGTRSNHHHAAINHRAGGKAPHAPPPAPIGNRKLGLDRDAAIAPLAAPMSNRGGDWIVPLHHGLGALCNPTTTTLDVISNQHIPTTHRIPPTIHPLCLPTAASWWSLEMPPRKMSASAS